MKLKIVLLFLFLFATILKASLEESVVRITSTLFLYDYKKPWNEAKQRVIIGSGVVIENKYILTSAHVVSNAKRIEVRKSSDFKKYFAKIKYISYQSDLALLEVYDKNFFKNMKALKISSKTKIDEKIKIAGYPLSRNDLLSKNGTISNIEYKDYSFSNENLLALKLKVDAKEGNSGGPILNKDGEILGIAMQIPKGGKNIAYGVPSLVINTFLEDIKDKKVDGFHSNSNSYQYLENESLQNYYNTKEIGMLVSDIDINENRLKQNDIILEVNGYKLSNITKKEFFLQLHSKVVGESVSLLVLRNEKVVKIDYILNYSKKLISQEFTSKPRYFIFGGLVFTPITRNYLQSVGMKQYEMNMLFYQQKRSLKRQEYVAWMETKFLDKINKGYTSKVEIVEAVNNTEVRDFEHFISLIENSKEKYIIINLINKQSVVLDKNEAIKSFSRLQKQYKF